MTGPIRRRWWTARRGTFGPEGSGRTTSRIWINLTVFAGLFIALAAWAATSVLQVSALEHPYAVTAEFTTSPGLHPGYAVTYLGVQVGRIGSVSIAHDHVNAVLLIDHTARIPAHVDAAAARMSAVGEPYIDLTPAGGADLGGPRLRDGAVIPVSRTTTPIQYATVFQSIDRLLDAVPPAQLQSLLNSMATGLQGRGQDIRQAITAVDALGNTLAQNSALLSNLADDLSAATQTVVDDQTAVNSTWNSLSILTQSLASSAGALSHLLETAPGFGQQVESLLDRSGPNIGCIFDSAGTLWSALAQPSTLNALSRTVTLAGPVAQLLQGTGFAGPDGFYLNGAFKFDLTSTSITMYNPPLELPPPPGVPTCTAPSVPGSTGSPSGTAGGTAPGALGSRPVPTPARPVSPGPRATGVSREAPGFSWWAFTRDVAIVVAGLGVIALVALTRPWRLVRRGGS